MASHQAKTPNSVSIRRESEDGRSAGCELHLNDRRDHRLKVDWLFKRWWAHRWRLNLRQGRRCGSRRLSSGRT